MKHAPTLLTALLFAPLAALHAADDNPPRPNILVILSDDQGYADVGFQGCKDIPTPNLDRLASEGLRCTDGYVTHPYCSPSRAGLMTGRYQARFGWEHNPPFAPDNHSAGVPLSEKFLPEFLKQAGYATGWIGKWHLGAAKEFLPQSRGFQETFGFISGGHAYLDWKPNPNDGEFAPIMQNGEAVDVKEHLTLAFGHNAADFVRRHKAEPWFLYLAFNAPHVPNEPTPERLAKFRTLPKKRRAYAAQVSLLDDAVGETLAALRETGQDRNTLVFFFSDNGAPVGHSGGRGKPNGGDNAPLREGKHSVYEGGVRVPFVVSWPGRLPSGRDYTQPVSSLDVFATALACAGVPPPSDRPCDGVDLVPYLSGQKAGAPHHELFWRLNERRQAAARVGVMKLVRDGDKPAQVFDLPADIGESRNVAQSEKKAGDLNKALDAWLKKMSKVVNRDGDGAGLEHD